EWLWHLPHRPGGTRSYRVRAPEPRSQRLRPALLGEPCTLLEGFPPRPVARVPPHGLCQSLLEVHARHVAELTADLSDVDRVALVVPLAVVHRHDALPSDTGCVQELRRELPI